MFHSIVSIILFTAIIGSSAFFVYTVFQQASPKCEKPLEYRIGDFDERFGLRHGQFVRALVEAEKIWEEKTGEDLFATQ